MRQSERIKEIRKLTLDNLGITRRWLNQKIADLVRKNPLTREEALWIIAQKSGVPMSKYLSREELRELREIVRSEVNHKAVSPVSRKIVTKKPTSKNRSKSSVRRRLSLIEKHPVYRVIVMIGVILGIIGFFIFL